MQEIICHILQGIGNFSNAGSSQAEKHVRYSGTMFIACGPRESQEYSSTLLQL